MFGGLVYMAMQETGTDNDTFDFEAALDNYSNSDFGDLEEGSLTTGEIVQIDDATVLVDVNFEETLFISLSLGRDFTDGIKVPNHPTLKSGAPNFNYPGRPSVVT